MQCPSCGHHNREGARFCESCGSELAASDASTEIDTAADLGLSPAFVGRRREMAELVSILNDALAGQGRLVMLAGERGIGKTRTAEEFAAVAKERGAQVLWGRSYEGEGQPPYWPWVQAIRSYAQQKETQQLLVEMGPGAPDIAKVVPEIRQRFPDLEATPTLEAGNARFRLFDSVATFLRVAAETEPLVIVLENLNWADRESLLLLEFLGQELASSHLLVVGTYWDVDLSRQHPLSETLGELTRQRPFHRLPLRGLSREEVHHFIRAASGVEPPAQLVEVVHSNTEGNPLFVTEVVRMLEQEGGLIQGGVAAVESGSVRIPEGVREVIGRRLNGLSERCNEILTVASVVGRQFRLDQLGQLIEDISEEGLLEVLEEALAAQVIDEMPEEVGHYKFSHGLIQRTLLDELSTTRRVRLHARIADAMEALYGEDAKSHADELAYHYAQAETVTGPDKLVRYSRMAGEQALAVYAWEEALTHFQRALAARESQPTDAESAAALAGLGRAQAATLERGQLQAAVDSLRRAFDYYAQVGDELRAVGTMLFHFPDVHGVEGLADLIQRAARLAPPDSRETGYLLSRYGTFVSFENGDYKAAQEAFGQALQIARREKDSALEMQTLASAATVDWLHLRLQESLEKGLRAIELAQQTDDLQAQFEAREVVSAVMTMTGEPEDVQVHTSEALALAEKLRSSITLALALSLHTVLSAFRGDWSGVRDSSDRAMSVIYRDYRFLVPRIWMEYQLGNFDQGAVYFDRLVPDLTRLGGNEAALVGYCARITGMHRGFEAVEATAKATLSSAATEPLARLTRRVALALIAVERRDPAMAVEQYTALTGSGGMTTGDMGMAIDRLLGLLAHTMDQPEKASTHFEDALAFCRKAGYRPELAWTCHDYADTLLTQNSTGDHQRAMSHLDEALAISTDLAMRPLMERVAALQERAGLLPAKAPVYPDGLTEREVEVLRLIAASKSNREIGEELFISLNTVARHVSNILTKTGCANRAGATAYAARQSLIR